RFDDERAVLLENVNGRPGGLDQGTQPGDPRDPAPEREAFPHAVHLLPEVTKRPGGQGWPADSYTLLFLLLCHDFPPLVLVCGYTFDLIEGPAREFSAERPNPASTNVSQRGLQPAP